MIHEKLFRQAEPADIPLVLDFIRQLAKYEHLEQEVTATEELLQYWLFEKHAAEVLFVLTPEGTEAGFALFFHNFSTFLGKAGIFLEDLFVKEKYRGQGYGKALLQKLAQTARNRQCGRLEWNCLDWNTPSINFYRSLNAVPLEEWTTYRLTGQTLDTAAQEADRHDA